jgi:hypothetical protein
MKLNAKADPKKNRMRMKTRKARANRVVLKAEDHKLAVREDHKAEIRVTVNFN